MEEEERGISVSEIFKVIFKRVWWVIGITAAVMLMFVLVVQFWYNRNAQTYTVTYSLDFPGIEDNSYPDGTTVRYNSIVSVSTLSEIVAGNEALSGVNVNEMVENDDIEFSQSVVAAEDSVSGVAERYFTLTVSVKYFSGADQAKTFLRAVANYPVSHAIAIANGLLHDSYLTVYNTADTFEDKLIALSSQYDYLLESYDELIESTSGEYAVDGKTLSEYRSQAALSFQNIDREYLDSIVATTPYVYNYEKFRIEYEPRKNKIEEEMTIYQALIDAQVEQRNEAIAAGASSSGDLAAFNTRIALYTQEYVELERELADLNKTNDWIVAADGDTQKLDSDVNSILNIIDRYREELVAQTEVLKNVYRSSFSEMCNVSFGSNIIEADGGINIILAAVIGIVIGFVLVSIVICVVDLPKYIRERNAAEAGEDGDAAEEE